MQRADKDSAREFSSAMEAFERHSARGSIEFATDGEVRSPKYLFDLFMYGGPLHSVSKCNEEHDRMFGSEGMRTAPLIVLVMNAIDMFIHLKQIATIIERAVKSASSECIARPHSA